MPFWYGMSLSGTERQLETWQGVFCHWNRLEFLVFARAFFGGRWRQVLLYHLSRNQLGINR